MNDSSRDIERDDRDQAVGEADPGGGGYNNQGGAGDDRAGGTDAPSRTPAGHVSGAQDEASLEADRKGD